MQLLINDGCIASVRLNDINGANLELYFKSNDKCDVILNNRLISELSYRNSEWFALHINLYSKGNEIWMRLGSNDFPIDWIYTGQIIHVGEIELASVAGPNWPVDGQPLFYVDDIQIKASGSVGTENQVICKEVKIFPNPVNEDLHIEIPAETDRPIISIFDFSGRKTEFVLEQEGLNSWKIPVANHQPGIYLINISSSANSYKGKFIITR